MTIFGRFIIGKYRLIGFMKYFGFESKQIRASCMNFVLKGDTQQRLMIKCAIFNKGNLFATHIFGLMIFGY